MNSKSSLFSFLILFLLFGIGFNNVYSQKIQIVKSTDLIPINDDFGKSSSENNVLEETKSLFVQLDGTFQLQLLKNDYKIIFSKNLYQMIKDNRLEDQDVSITLDENSMLFIPSSQKIRSINFEKLPQIVFIKQ
jgi:hypothetical protein